MTDELQRLRMAGSDHGLLEVHLERKTTKELRLAYAGRDSNLSAPKWKSRKLLLDQTSSGNFLRIPAQMVYMFAAEYNFNGKLVESLLLS
jgi:hypothetical protein